MGLRPFFFLALSLPALAAPAAPVQLPSPMSDFILSEVQDGLKIAAHGRKFRYKPEVAQKIADALMRWSNQFNLEPLLVLAVMTQESHFVPNLVSKKGAIGLMQVMPRTVLDLCEGEGWRCPKTRTEVFDPEKNVEYGVRTLYYMLGCTQSFLASLAAYNQGCHRVRLDLQQGQTLWNFSTLVLGHYSNLLGRFNAKYPSQTMPKPPAALQAHPVTGPAN